MIFASKTCANCRHPQKVLDEMPVSDTIAAHIVNSRKAAEKIIHGGDDRLLVIVGPCSIHDTKAALEYGRLLALAAKAHEKRLHIIMRMYFEKPRTTIGWKGLINDPYLNGTYAINDGLRMARRVLLELNGLGLPCGTEFLDIISPQYFADLISWGRDWRAHHRKSITPRVGFRSFLSGGLQKRHKRRY